MENNAIIIDGKKTASKLLDKLKQEIEKLPKKPCLAVILANDNPASTIYVNSKEKKARDLGIESVVYRFNKDVSKEEIKILIEKLNNDNNITAILVQLPLFSHLDEDEIIELIDPKKDVDGFHPINAGRLNRNLAPYAYPCTPKGIVKLFREYNIEIKSKNILVIGRSNIVGKPLASMLTNLDATVTLAHSKTKNLSDLCLKSDVIISATGQSKLIKEHMVKNGTTIVDVGINRNSDNKIEGDVDFYNVKNKAGFITPVPGGVGPMTIACLMENTLELFLKFQKGVQKGE